MDDDMHMYEIVGSQGEGQKLSDKTERVTSLDDKQEYMSLHGQDGALTNEYQEPQSSDRNTRVAVNNDKVIRPSESLIQKDELKQMKRCLCMLSLLVVILFLITISSLCLAAYGFDRIVSSASRLQIQKVSFQLTSLITTMDTRINDTNLQIVASLMSLRATLNTLESRLNIMINLEVVSQRTFVNTLESQFNTTNAEVISQRTFVNSLETRFNTTNAQVISQGTLINTLNSRLNEINSLVLPCPL